MILVTSTLVRAVCPMILLINACWLGAAAGLLLFWLGGVGSGLLCALLGSNLSVAAVGLVFAFRSRR